MGTSLRLFVAVYPPAETVAHLRSLAAAHPSLPPGVFTPAEQVHLTLLFIGDSHENRLSDISESVRRSCAGISPFSLRVESLGTLPHKGSKRLLAAMVSSPPPLIELQRRLSHRLARRPHAKRGEEFCPHITLYRFRPQAPNDVGVARAPQGGEAASCDRIEFEVQHVALVRSVITDAGAEHRTLESFPLV